MAAPALLAVGFFGLAAWFLFGAPDPELPIVATPDVAASDLSLSPRRTRLGDPPRVVVNGFERTCMDCHRTFPPPTQDPPVPLRQHEGIRLEHGPHRQCRTCHDAADRDFLVTNTGTRVGFAGSRALCAGCHVTTASDQAAGMHGRTNGYWDASSGEVRRLDCVDCHDPHAPRHPAMDPLHPLPGPRTLRMGDPSAGGHGSDEPHGPTDPLSRGLHRQPPGAGSEDDR